MTEPEDQEFSAFFGREFERTVRTVYLVLHDQQAAEDVAQDAFGQLYRSSPG
jgi:DNA-directed RNA polymerase specialized sigma24 family protein